MRAEAQPRKHIDFFLKLIAAKRKYTRELMFDEAQFVCFMSD